MGKQGMLPLWRKRDAWVVALLLTAAGVVWLVLWLTGEPGKTAGIYRDGERLLTVDLAEDGVLFVDGLEGVVFAVQEGGIAFTTSDCPDQICVRTGYLHQSGETAVCLPRRISVTVDGGDGVDGIAR